MVESMFVHRTHMYSSTQIYSKEWVISRDTSLYNEPGPLKHENEDVLELSLPPPITKVSDIVVL